MMWICLLFVLSFAQDIDSEEFSHLTDTSEEAFIHPYSKVIIDHPDAKCLDGSSTVYYYQQGEDDQTLIMYFYSGGFCIEDGSYFDKYDGFAFIDSCHKRQQTFFGSTKSYPDTFDSAQGLMGSSKYQNKNLRGVSKIWLMPCDGSIWYKQMNEDVFRFILDSLPIKPLRLILAGSEVGAFYLMANANKFAEIANIETKLLLDSAVYDFPQESQVYKALEEVASRLNLKITDLYSLDMMLNIKVPTFFVQSQYDWWFIEVVHEIDCTKKLHLEGCTPNEKKVIEDLRKKQTKLLLKLMKERTDFGLFHIGCVFHDLVVWTQSWNHPSYQLDQLWLSDAFQNWLDNIEGKNIHYDQEPWPYNRHCSNKLNMEPDESFDDLKKRYEAKERQMDKDEYYAQFGDL